MGSDFTSGGAGRFAPSPSGPLHFGSLITALASFCQAKSTRSSWLVRIEDVDTPRVVKGAADDILRTLEAFGFCWDGPVVFQSSRFDAYEAVLQNLIRDNHVYACECSRKQLQRENPHYGPLGLIYPSTCRYKNLPIDQHSLRLDLQRAGSMSFHDAHYGDYALSLPEQVGDVVLKRVDGVYAYHLAVVVDDAWQGIRQIVRGADLLSVTPLHRYLYQLLQLPEPGYLHLPLARNPDGKKLSKQTAAAAIDPTQAALQLVAALNFLGQPCPDELQFESPQNVLKHAISEWNLSTLPAIDHLD